MSKTTLVAKQVRLQQWAEDIRSCNCRPSGTTVNEWCDEHGIKKSVYYWRLRAVRKACLDAVEKSDDVLSEDETIHNASFVEIQPSKLQTVRTSSATINFGNATIEIAESISDSFLHRIMEAVYHAQ